MFSCAQAISRVSRCILGPQCLSGYGAFLNSCEGITSLCDFCLPLLQVNVYFGLLCLDRSLPPSFSFTQILKTLYLYSYAFLHICACTNLLYIFQFWILNKILLSSMLSRINPATLSQINWQVLLFASICFNFSFALFPWSSATPLINRSWGLQGRSCRKETSSVPEFKSALLLLSN